ncbi:MAG: helix-turn-helix transcriptional regulator [Bacteroidia bacterium]|nr:helix-turn-helix transcriptional regulator [Bacteroidia bacterium]
MKLGAKLHQCREDTRMSQAEFADFIGVSSSTYGRLERNEVSIDLELLLKIVQKLNLSLADFLPEDFLNNNLSSHKKKVEIRVEHISICNYYGVDETLSEIQQKLEKMQAENELLRSKLAELEGKNPNTDSKSE